MGIFNDLRIAFFDFRGYPKLLKKGKKHAVAFGFLIVTLFWIMTSVVPVVMFFTRTGGFSQIVETYAPEFTLQNGVLQTDQAYHFANGRIYVDINTDPSNVVDPSDQKFRTILSLNDMVFAADSKRAVLKATPFSGGGQTRLIEFSSFEGMTVTKDYLRELAPVMNAMECFMCVLFFFIHLAGFFIYSWIIAFTGRIFARLYRMNLSMRTVFPLAVYTRAFPVLTEGVFYLGGIIFAEMAAIGMLYSMYALTRVFRYMAMSGNYPGRGYEEARESGEGCRNAGEEYRARGDEDRVPTPKTPDGGGYFPQDQTGSGGVISGSRNARDAENAENAPKARNAENAPKDRGGAGETHRETEESGKPVYRPDHTEIREALVTENLKPSDGWSFGSSAAAPEKEAEAAAPGAAAETAEDAAPGAAAETAEDAAYTEQNDKES